jgi:hypothetical protein
MRIAMFGDGGTDRALPPLTMQTANSLVQSGFSLAEEEAR